MTRDIMQQIFSIWDEDAAVYDRNHSAPRPQVLAAWADNVATSSTRPTG